MVKKHTLGEFQFSSPNVTLVCPLKTKMTVLKNMKNVLFYLSWQHAFVLFYLFCPEPFNYSLSLHVQFLSVADHCIYSIRTMATASAAATVGEIKEHLVCAICLDQLADTRLLPCQHTFCYKCLVRAFNKPRREHGMHRGPYSAPVAVRATE